MDTETMKSTVAALLNSGKGILAADESLATIGARFEALDIPSTEENRRRYRELLFTTPELGHYISGAILFDETIRQHSSDGVPFPVVLREQGIIPGIKVDMGTIPLANAPDEKITQGLDGLATRLVEYHKLGARFTKWRAVFTVGNNLPSHLCLIANAEALARFAALSQEAGMVPIVEPEVLMQGRHTIERCEEVTAAVLYSVFEALYRHGASLELMLLKSGMVLSGADCPDQASDAAVAEMTVRCFRRHVPAAVPGIVFLSGGQSPADATERLNAICNYPHGPWKITFSYGRALQDVAMKIWKGIPQHVSPAQLALHHRARCNSAAAQGGYSSDREFTAD